MVVQELIAKLGFDVDAAGMQKAEAGLSRLTNVAVNAVGAFAAARREFDALMHEVAKTPGLLPKLPSAPGGAAPRIPGTKGPRLIAGDMGFIGPALPEGMGKIVGGITRVKDASEGAAKGVDKVTASVRRLGAESKSTGPGLDSIENGLGSLLKKATLFAAGMYIAKQGFDALVAGVMGSINAASQKEDVTTQFKVLLGDLEAAKYLYQEVNQYAAVSPFETAGLAENTKTLIAMGMSAKSAFTDLKMLGDVALGDQAKLSRMALTYGQVMSLGRLQGDNMREFALQGWNPLTYWQAKSGKSMEQLRKDMEKGLISSAMVQEALAAATAQGGKFYKGAEEGAKTWSGMLSTMRDNIRMMGAAIGDKLLPLLKEVLRAISAIWVKFEGTGLMIGKMLAVFMEHGMGAVDIAMLLADAFHLVGTAIGGALILWEQFMLDIDLGKIAVFGLAGMFRDWYDFIGLGIAKIFSKVFKFLGWAGDKLGIESLSSFKKNASTVDENIADYSPGRFTKAYTADAAKDAQSRGDAILKLWDLMGERQHGDAKMKLTDKIDAILSGKSAKQPITNITQNNNLTVNAEDPIKTMGESAAARFFQGAFIELRHATV